MSDLHADRLALRYLSESYALGCDTRDVSLLLPLFVDGGTITVHWLDKAPSTMTAPHDLERIPSGLSRFDRTFHFIGNHRAEVDGDTATGVTYCFAHHITGRDDHVMTIRYEDQYRREGGTWKIVERHLRLQWTSDTTI